MLFRSLILVRASVNAGQSEYTRTPPESVNWVQQRVHGRSVSARMGGEHTNSGRASQVPARNQSQGLGLWSAMQGAERHARLLACAADAEYRDCSCRSAERQAESLATQNEASRSATERTDA